MLHEARHGHRTEKDIARWQRIIPLISVVAAKMGTHLTSKGTMLWEVTTEEWKERLGMFGD